ncbi:GntR family transcriptional regulator [Candidatus Aerophobetes bacterium]|nr:GntR family transcriptional regulator [Candidatus Aerophobetes bacterium]
MDKNSVYSILREKIVLGDYKPGQVLKEKELMKEFNIGRTPLRELLVRLDAEGLVEIVPYSGVHVSSVEFKELIDVMELRRPLIKIAGKLAAERATKDEIEKMKNLLNKFKDNLDEKELIKLDSKFHDLINMATHNQVLYGILQALRDRVLRLWILPKDKSFVYTFREDFQRLISAIEKKDKDSSANILAAHAEFFIEKIKAQL